MFALAPQESAKKSSKKKKWTEYEKTLAELYVLADVRPPPGAFPPERSRDAVLCYIRRLKKRFGQPPDESGSASAAQPSSLTDEQFMRLCEYLLSDFEVGSASAAQPSSLTDEQSMRLCEYLLSDCEVGSASAAQPSSLTDEQSMRLCEYLLSDCEVGSASAAQPSSTSGSNASQVKSTPPVGIFYVSESKVNTLHIPSGIPVTQIRPTGEEKPRYLKPDTVLHSENPCGNRSGPLREVLVHEENPSLRMCVYCQSRNKRPKLT